MEQKYFLNRDAVKELCKKNQITQSILCKRIGITPGYLNALTRGKFHATEQIIYSFHDYLKCDFNKFFTPA